MNSPVPVSFPSFTASVQVDGATVFITAATLASIATLLGRLEASGVVAPAPQPATTAAEKAAVAGAADAVQKAAAKPQKETPPAGKSESAPPAAKPSDASGSASAGVAYDDVKKAVNALYVIDPKHAVDALAKFKGADGEPVKNGKLLDPKDWIAFVEHARAQHAELTKEGAPA